MEKEQEEKVEPGPPDYLIALNVALNELRLAQADGKVDPRLAAIAITDTQKLIAFVAMYLSTIE